LPFHSPNFGLKRHFATKCSITRSTWVSKTLESTIAEFLRIDFAEELRNFPLNRSFITDTANYIRDVLSYFSLNIVFVVFMSSFFYFTVHLRLVSRCTPASWFV